MQKKITRFYTNAKKKKNLQKKLDKGFGRSIMTTQTKQSPKGKGNKIMKITVTEAMFKNAFVKMNRADNFSSAGLSALFEYCEERETDLGEEYELDVIALCCDFSEAFFADIADDYSIDLSGCDGSEEEFEAVLEYLNNETMAVYSDSETGMILYQNF